MQPIHEFSHHEQNEFECEKDIRNLSVDDQATLDKVYKLEIRGMNEEEAIMSVIDGKTIKTNQQDSMTSGFMRKMHSITSRTKQRYTKIEHINNDVTSVDSIASNTNIFIKDDDSFCMNFSSDGSSHQTINDLALLSLEKTCRNKRKTK